MLSPAIQKWWEAHLEAERVQEKATLLMPTMKEGAISATVGISERDEPCIYLSHHEGAKEIKTYELTEDEAWALAQFILGEREDE